jgi:hypothetical protein
MINFMIGLAFVVMVLSPAVVASMQRFKSHEDD